MHSQILPLSKAFPGKQYLIKSVHKTDAYSTDLHGYGLIPGASIKLLFSSPSKDPSAYEVMGTVIAIRQKDSKNIYVSDNSI